MEPGDANAARLVQRLQLGAGRPRRARRLQPPVGALAAARRALLLPRLRSAGALDAARAARTPVFQLAFAHSGAAGHLLAAADEDGAVALLDTRPAAATGARSAAAARWPAHRNAVFDVVWTRDDRQLVTAAGDLQLRGWDAETRRAAFALAGHRMSVKCVRQLGDSHTFASGARDGHVLLWDARLPSGGDGATGGPVGALPSVHAAPAAAPVSRKPGAARRQAASGSFLSPPPAARKQRRPAAALGRPAPPRSVTCVDFAPSGREVVTAGAVDGVVKFWDLRRLAPPSAVDAVPATLRLAPTRQVDCGARPGAQRGVSALAFGCGGAVLLVSVLNDAIKVVDALAAGASGAVRGRPAALLECVGHAASSFYVKAAFSPDDEFIVGGSADGAVYIWDASVSVGRPWSRSRSAFQSADELAPERRLPLLALKGHTGDVNGVAWSRRDFASVASASDDGTVRLWRADRQDPDAENPREADSFLLREAAAPARGWSNWKDFLQQPDGAAYPVAAAGCPTEDARGARTSHDAVHERSAASPVVIHRSEGLRGHGQGSRRRPRPTPTDTDSAAAADAGADHARGRPVRRRTASASSAGGPRQQTTLLDCWQR